MYLHRQTKLMAFGKVEFSDASLREKVVTYISQHVTGSYFERANLLFKQVQAADKCIPQSYVEHMESRNVGQIRATVFNKKIHGDTLANLEAFTTLTDTLHKVIKAGGHLTSGAILGNMKSQDGRLKNLKVYGVSSHGANILLNKLPGLTNRERAATLREPLFFFHY